MQGGDGGIHQWVVLAPKPQDTGLHEERFIGLREHLFPSREGAEGPARIDLGVAVSDPYDARFTTRGGAGVPRAERVDQGYRPAGLTKVIGDLSAEDTRAHDGNVERTGHESS